MFYKQVPTFLLVNGRRPPAPIHMTVGDTNRLRIVSIHATRYWISGFADDSTVARWKPIARDGADLPDALRKPDARADRDGTGPDSGLSLPAGAGG